ncbi:ESPR domain-containing protein [Pseudomonas fragi]
MNKIFSVVWNYSLGSWVVTSEFAHKKNKSGPCKGIRTLGNLRTSFQMC